VELAMLMCLQDQLSVLNVELKHLLRADHPLSLNLLVLLQPHVVVVVPLFHQVPVFVVNVEENLQVVAAVAADLFRHLLLLLLLLLLNLKQRVAPIAGILYLPMLDFVLNVAVIQIKKQLLKPQHHQAPLQLTLLNHHEQQGFPRLLVRIPVHVTDAEKSFKEEFLLPWIDHGTLSALNVQVVAVPSLLAQVEAAL